MKMSLTVCFIFGMSKMHEILVISASILSDSMNLVRENWYNEGHFKSDFMYNAVLNQL